VDADTFGEKVFGGQSTQMRSAKAVAGLR